MSEMRAYTVGKPLTEGRTHYYEGVHFNFTSGGALLLTK
jgi:hypothetical protein